MARDVKFPKAWAVVSDYTNRSDHPLTLTAELPIFWMRRVAKNVAAKNGGRVIPVTIKQVLNG